MRFGALCPVCITRGVVGQTEPSIGSLLITKIEAIKSVVAEYSTETIRFQEASDLLLTVQRAR